MTTNEVAKAAERLLEYAEQYPGKPLDGQCVPCAIRLAHTYLADSAKLAEVEAERDRYKAALEEIAILPGNPINGGISQGKARAALAQPAELERKDQ